MTDTNDERVPYDDCHADTMNRIGEMSAHEAAKILSDSMFWGQEGPGFSCTEAEALAALIYQAGGATLAEAADLVVAGHGHGDMEGRGDEPGDLHYCTEPTYEEAPDAPSTDR